MSKEDGITLTQVLVLLVIILIICAVSTFIFNQKIKTEGETSIKANMLVIQGKCNVSKEKADIVSTQEQSQTTGNKVEIAKEESTMYGQKVSEAKQDNEIIQNFLSLNILKEAEYDSYYVLYDNDLESLKVDFLNEKGAYYIVNYETGEVIYTSGINGKYKVSEMVNEVVNSVSEDTGTDEVGENTETAGEPDKSTETPED